MNVALVLAYLAKLGLNIVALRRIDLKRQLFVDGLILGLTYYIMMPMAVILINSRIGSNFLKEPDYAL